MFRLFLFCANVIRIKIFFYIKGCKFVLLLLQKYVIIVKEPRLENKK